MSERAKAAIQDLEKAQDLIRKASAHLNNDPVDLWTSSEPKADTLANYAHAGLEQAREHITQLIRIASGE